MAEPVVPPLSLAGLFRRFLGFGLRAWGGPVAQLGMLKAELVDEERWVSPERFHRALAVYQVLPGPEAHEMCVWFGMLARGRVGAVLAGLGFMLPGLVLMLLLAWLYVSVGIDRPLVAAALAGLQAAVVALVARAVHRIGRHALTTWWLAALAAISLGAGLAGVPFWFPLALCVLLAPLLTAGRWTAAVLVLALALVVAALVGPSHVVGRGPAPTAGPQAPRAVAAAPSTPELAVYGLRAGLLTFGGAYTAIPFLQHDAVVRGAWMTDAQFLDGLGLSGTLPAPLIIFGTFVGYLGGGLVGALAITLGIFLPAFLFTLLGHGLLERLVESRRLRAALAGASACVVGLIAATAVGLLRAAIGSPVAGSICAAALLALCLWRSRAAVPTVVLGGGLLGLLLLG